jgi:hypothetical protein
MPGAGVRRTQAVRYRLSVWILGIVMQLGSHESSFGKRGVYRKRRQEEIDLSVTSSLGNWCETKPFLVPCIPGSCQRTRRPVGLTSEVIARRG